MIDLTHPFSAAIKRAVDDAYDMCKPNITGDEEIAPEPILLPAPPYCDIYRNGGPPKFRAKVWYAGASHALGYFPMTEDGQARAAACALAARDARDAGATLDEVKRAGRMAGGLPC